MKKKLRILILEDVPEETERIKYELAEGGISFFARLTDGQGDFISALQDFVPDVILADYSLPGFDGFRAMQVANARCPGVPFIVISGALGEETAIDLLKAGATDYVLKHRLSRLGPAVIRAVRETHERQKRREAAAALEEKTQSLRDASATLRIFLRRWGKCRTATYRERVLMDIRETVLHAVHHLRDLKPTKRQEDQMQIVERDLEDLFSLFPFKTGHLAPASQPHATSIPHSEITPIEEGIDHVRKDPGSPGRFQAGRVHAPPRRRTGKGGGGS